MEASMNRFIAAALASVLAGICTASAQDVVTDPNAIAGCLCQNQSLGALKSGVDAAQRLYDRDRARIDDYDRQLEQARGAANVAMQSQVDAIKDMNLARERLYAQTYDVDLPALQVAIETYDRAAQSYTGQCADRNFDAIWMARMQEHLVCPVPPNPPAL
jgi:hypothetical protein